MNRGLMKRRTTKLIIGIVITVLALFLMFTQDLFFRIDLTKEKRFSIANSSKNILRATDDRIDVQLYLTGELDANMTRLRYAVKTKVSDLNAYANKQITLKEWDPNEAEDDDERYKNYRRLEEMGMKGMSVAVKNDKGGISQSVVFPWLNVCYKNDTIPVCLLNPNTDLSPTESVNGAIEDIEYLIVDAIRILSNPRISKIAFIEGHGELNEMETYNVSESLSRYFQVDRGVIGGQVGILDGYDAIIIANPREAFPEEDKYVIDQYVMQGGSVLWSIDGVRMSDTLLSESGTTPVIPIDLNLGDMLFRYGVKISNTVVQDMQCASTPVNIAMAGERPKFENIPWYYNPLLNTSPYHPITKNKAEVMSDMASALEFALDTLNTTTDVLLITGNASRVKYAPLEIDIKETMNVDPKEYFVHRYVPIAALVEGRFTSLFKNRMIPPSVKNAGTTRMENEAGKMIVVADGSIMRNNIEQKNGGLWVVPLGYDRATQRTYGNSDFIVNSLLYLTDYDGLMELRNRTIPVRLLNMAMAQQTKTRTIIINICLPIAALCLLAMIMFTIRKRRYTR